jgi:hypothetical protein
VKIKLFTLVKIKLFTLVKIKLFTLVKIKLFTLVKIENAPTVHTMREVDDVSRAHILNLD